MPHARILATGSHVPARAVSNEELDALMGAETAAWLAENTGIRARRWMAPGERTSDLAAAAARAALARAGVHARDLDLLVVSTDTPDQPSPPTAVVVHERIGAGAGCCYDLNSACAGWVTALDQAARHLETEPGARHALVVGAYGMSRFLQLSDPRTANLFGDGAGAVVLGVGPEPGRLGSSFRTLSEHHDAMGIFSGGTARPCTGADGRQRVEFRRRFPPGFNTGHWPDLVRRALAPANLGPGDVALFLFTQLNLRTIEETMRVLGQPMSRTHWVMDRFGYTGSGCVAMALDDAVAQGRGPAPGEVVVFCASGGGITMAASAWRWTGAGG